MANGKFTNQDVKNAQDFASASESIAESTNRFAAAAQSARDNVKQYGAELDKIGKGAEGMEGMFSNAKKDVNSLADSIGKLATFNKQDLKDRKKRGIIQKSLTDVENKRAKISSRIASNNERLVNATGEERDNLIAANKILYNSRDAADGILEDFEGINDEINRINKGSNFAKKLADGVRDIPGLGPLLAGPIDDIAKGIDLMNAGIDEGAEGIEAMALLTNGLLKSALLFMTKAMFDADKSVTDMAKQLGVSKDEAQDIADRFNYIALSSEDSTINAQKLSQAFMELGDSVGAVTGFTDEQVVMQSKLTNLLGLQADEAAKLTKFSISQGKSSRELTESILDQVVALEKETGIRLDGRKVLAEVLSISGNLSASYGFQAEELAKAVVQANRLGLSLKEAEGISRSLLDFESSIEAEMAAELMTGRNLELSRARSLALDGKSAEAVAELAKQFGTAEEFSKLNVLAREDLAEALGMEADQLADSIKKQEILNKLGEKSIADALANGMARDEIIAAGGEELLLQYEQQAAADKFADTMANIQSAVGTILNGFMPIIDVVANIASSAGTLYSVLASIAAISLVGTIAKLASMAVSLGMSAASAIALASGITLGLGAIAVAAGITAMMAAKNKAEKQSTTNIGDGVIGPSGNIIATDPADFLMATKDPAGLASDLGGGSSNSEQRKTNSLLTALLNKSATVTMDGNQLGTATTLTSYELQ